MNEMLLVQPAAPDDASWTLPPGQVACVSGMDEVHEVLDCMRAHGLRQVLLAEANDRRVTIIRQEDLVPYAADPFPRLLQEVEGAGKVRLSQLPGELGNPRRAGTS